MKHKITNKAKTPKVKNNLKKKASSCFSNCIKNKKLCKNKKCRLWFESKEFNNCSVVASESGPRTLQEIGDLFGLTRMRICQIEKSAMIKLKDKINLLQ